MREIYELIVAWNARAEGSKYVYCWAVRGPLRPLKTMLMLNDPLIGFFLTLSISSHFVIYEPSSQKNPTRSFKRMFTSAVWVHHLAVRFTTRSEIAGAFKVNCKVVSYLSLPLPSTSCLSAEIKITRFGSKNRPTRKSPSSS